MSWYYAKKTDHKFIIQYAHSTVCYYRSLFHQALVVWLWRAHTEDQTEAIHYARLSCLKQLLNDVIFIWFTDKNVFTFYSNWKKSHNNWLYSPIATKKKDVGAKCFLCARMTFSHSLMVPVGGSKFDYAGFILLDPGVKINQIWYRSLLLPQQLLSVIRHVSGEFRNSAPAYRSC